MSRIRIEGYRQLGTHLGKFKILLELLQNSCQNSSEIMGERYKIQKRAVNGMCHVGNISKTTHEIMRNSHVDRLKCTQTI